MIDLTWEIISKWDIVPRICRKVFKRKIHRYLPDHKSKTNLSVNVRMSGEKGRKVWQIGSGSFRGNVCVFYRGARFIAKKVFLVVSVVIGKNGSEVFRSFFRLRKSSANTNRTKRSFRAFYLEKLSVAKLKRLFF